MDHKGRLACAFDLGLPDRPPILGGWLAAPNHVQALTGCTEDEYYAAPEEWSVRAECALGSDGIIAFWAPVDRGDYRCIGEETLRSRESYTMERILAEIAALPEPDAQRAAFDEERAYAAFRIEHLAAQARCGDMLWCPADWEMIPHALWFFEYGYENAMLLPRLHQNEHRKLMRWEAERGRQIATLRARAIVEGIHPRAILTGEDQCSQRGPMISPAFLRREYFPLLEYAMEPLLAVGAKLIWHCDGDVRKILNDVLACGIGGLQGFQTECGMDVEWIVRLRTSGNGPLIIFGPLSVTETLPFGSPEDVRREVRRAMDVCRDQASLVFFTSNTINPDVPLENVRAFWDAALASHW